MRTILLSFLLIPGLLACRDSRTTAGGPPETPPAQTKSALDGIVESLNAHVDAAGNAVKSLSPQAEELQSQTTRELEKLYQVEYHIADIAMPLTTEELQSKMSELGREGWECFSVLPEAKGYRVFCKRRPKTILRYLKNVPLL